MSIIFLWCKESLPHKKEGGGAPWVVQLRLIEINGQGCMTHKHPSPKGQYVKKLHFTLKGKEDDTLLDLGFRVYT